MGLFDKILDKLKGIKSGELPPELVEEEKDYEGNTDVVISSEQEESEQEADTENVVCDAKCREEYIRRFRNEFRHYFPSSLDTVESHMQLPYMVCAAVDISPVIEQAREKIYARFDEEPEKLEELSRAAVAKVAMAIEKYLGGYPFENAELSCSRAQRESLEKAWIVLDFYRSMLKAEYTGNIGKIYELVTNQLITRGAGTEEPDKAESYEELLARCSKLASGDADAPELSELKRKLFERLFGLDSIYVVHDGTFNKAFPYVGADGRLEIQTNRQRAEALGSFIESKGGSKVVIEEYANTDLGRFFTMAMHNGLTLARLDNGGTPVEIDISEYFDSGEDNILEVCNRYVRGMFIRELQYGYRLKGFTSEKRESEEYKVLTSAMLGARSCGYRALAGGLVYAFNIGGGRKGVTLYTPNALEKASEIMKVMGEIDDSILIAPGDSSYEVFEGELALRAVQKRDSAPESGMVCAFTDKENADKIYQRFTDGGANCAVVVVTLAELCRQCSNCAGFILDMTSYGIELPREMFLKISESVRAGGQIVAGKEM